VFLNSSFILNNCDCNRPRSQNLHVVFAPQLESTTAIKIHIWRQRIGTDPHYLKLFYYCKGNEENISMILNVLINSGGVDRPSHIAPPANAASGFANPDSAFEI
jgi:hypothetical protein